MEVFIVAYLAVCERRDPKELYHKASMSEIHESLVNHEPGGSKLYQSIFCKTNLQYINEIELSGQTDSVIWVGVLGAFENAS